MDNDSDIGEDEKPFPKDSIEKKNELRETISKLNEEKQDNTECKDILKILNNNNKENENNEKIDGENKGNEEGKYDAYNKDDYKSYSDIENNSNNSQKSKEVSKIFNSPEKDNNSFKGKNYSNINNFNNDNNENSKINENNNDKPNIRNINENINNKNFSSSFENNQNKIKNSGKQINQEYFKSFNLKIFEQKDNQKIKNQSYFTKYKELPEDNDGLYIDPKKVGKFTSNFAGIYTIIYLIGAGILSAPIIMRYLGLVIGFIFYIFMAIITFCSIHFLLECQKITGKNGFSMFGKITLGKFGSILVKIFLIIKGLGLCIIYLRIFGKSLQIILQYWISPDNYLMLDTHIYIYILFGAVIFIFFTLIKDFLIIKKSVYFAIIIVVVIFICLLILLIYKSIGKNLNSDISFEFLYPNCSFTKAIHTVLILFITFLFPSKAFLINNFLKDKNTKSLRKSLIIGLTVSLIIYTIIGIIGFLLYGFEIDNTILECFKDEMVDYRKKNILIIILLIIICIGFISLCFISFPKLFLSFREDFIHLIIICLKIFSRNKKRENESKSINNINNKCLIAITFALYLLVFIIAILKIKFQVILSIVGATVGIFFIFIFPNLFYIIIINKARKKNNIAIPIILIGLGAAFGIIPFYLLLTSRIDI